jgi:hypothetical protein
MAVMTQAGCPSCGCESAWDLVLDATQARNVPVGANGAYIKGNDPKWSESCGGACSCHETWKMAWGRQSA